MKVLSFLNYVHLVVVLIMASWNKLFQIIEELIKD